MRVLTDFHHHALAESLLRVFTDRFDWEVYFPYEMAWFDEGYWNFEREWHGDAVARQYLQGVWATLIDDDDNLPFPHVDRMDPREPGRVQRGVTLEVAKAQTWDIVLCSLPANYDGFYRLAQETGAKYGIQIGNELQPFDPRADFCLSSSTLPGYGPEYIGKTFDVEGVPTLMYHQEFDTETFRPEWPPSERNSVASFIQCFAENVRPYAEFLDLARVATDLDWRVYGAYGSHEKDEFAAGDISNTPEVADRMRATRVVWHSKSWSDGFGHVIHNSFSVGRPVVGRASYYTNRLAGPLWVEGVTSFDIDLRTKEETLSLLRRLVWDDDFHRQISENAAARFKQVVDFDAEAEQVKALLARVL